MSNWTPWSADEETKDEIKPIQKLEGKVTARSLAGWLQDLVAENAEEDGGQLDRIEAFGVGTGFVVVIDGKRFDIGVTGR